MATTIPESEPVTSRTPEPRRGTRERQRRLVSQRTTKMPGFRAGKQAIRSAVGMAMLSVFAGAGWSQARPHKSLPILTRVSQVRALTADEAKRKYPIHFRGVIAYHAPEYLVTFFQDETAGIFIFQNTNPRIDVGSLVEIDGNTTPGDFAPSIENARVRVLGRAALPASAPKALDDLLTGSEDSQWVAARGIVHSVTIENRLPPDMRGGPPQLVLEIVSGNHRFKARIKGFHRDADYSHLVDSSVTVRGARGTLFNDRRQLVGVQLFVPSLKQLTVDRAAPADPYELPVLPVGNLMQFSPERASGSRVRIRGVVTLRSSGSRVFVQDDSGGVLVESEQTTVVEPGDLVDAIGFRVADSYAPILQDSGFRRIGKGRPPEPVDLTGAASLSSGRDATLVRIGGRLLDQSLGGEYRVLTMQLGDHTLTGRLAEKASAERVRSIRNGSQLQMVGVWSVETDEYRRPVAYQVLLRSAADVVVVQQPPWLSGPRMDGLAGVVLLGLLWVIALRRRVAAKTEILRAALESTADGILVVNSKEQIVTYNDKFLAMWRIPRSRARSKSHEALLRFVAEQLKSPDTFVDKVHQLSTNAEAQRDEALEFKDGRVFERHAEPQRVNGKIVGHVLGFRDVTEHRRDVAKRERAMEALRKSEKRYRTIVETAAEGICMTDAECRVTFVNQRMTEMLVVSAGDVLGHDMHEFFAAEDRATAASAWRLLQEGSKTAFETRLIARDRPALWVSVSASRVVDSNTGRFAGMLGMFTDVTERKKAEESQHLMESVVMNAHDTVLVTKADHPGGEYLIAFANPAFTREMGYSSEEIVGKPPAFYLSPKTNRLEVERITRLLSENQPCRGESLVHRRDGSEIWVEVSYVPVPGAGGQASHRIAIGRDITERKRMEDDLRKLSSAVEQSPVSVMITDLESRIQYVNPSFTSLTGYTLEEALGQNASIMKSGETSREEDEKMWLTIRGGANWKGIFHNRKKNGELYWESATIGVICDSQGVPVHYLQVAEDVTRQKAMEAALKVSEERFRIAAEHASDLIWEMDLIDRRVWVFGPVEELLGLSREEIEGSIDNWTQSIHPDDRDGFMAMVRTCFKRRQSSPFEYRRLRRDGAVRYWADRGTAVLDASGRPSKWIGVSSDITERKRLQRQLVEAQKLESIGALAAGIAHEINTPIQYIGDNARFLANAFRDLFQANGRHGSSAETTPGADDKPAARVSSSPADVDADYLRREVPAAIGDLEDGVAQVSRIVRAMKVFSHPGPVEKSPVDINLALESTILVSQSEWKYVADVKSEFDPELPPVPCVGGEMNQVFLNLIINAAHAISVVVRSDGEKGVITVSTRRNGAWAEIRVQDTGTGIPEEIRPRIFDPFFTTKEVGKGTGQGLSIAHAVVVQKHQGSIQFESQMGVGTTFLIRLPLGSESETR